MTRMNNPICFLCFLFTGKLDAALCIACGPA
jgi:hypothetical protein